MKRTFYRLWLSINSTFWMISVFGIKNSWKWFCSSELFTDVLLVAIPLMSSLISIIVIKNFTYSESGEFTVEEIELADNNLLPIYLGYFFISLGLTRIYDLCWVYLIVLLFVYLLCFQYFNPLFILFGYHFYYAKTQYGTKVFLILKGKVVRNSKEIDISKIQRLNDSTFVGWLL